jgi:hypothetical protein
MLTRWHVVRGIDPSRVLPGSCALSRGPPRHARMHGHTERDTSVRWGLRPGHVRRGVRRRLEGVFVQRGRPSGPAERGPELQRGSRRSPRVDALLLLGCGVRVEHVLGRCDGRRLRRHRARLLLPGGCSPRSDRFVPRMQPGLPRERGRDAVLLRALHAFSGHLRAGHLGAGVWGIGDRVLLLRERSTRASQPVADVHAGHRGRRGHALLLRQRSTPRGNGRVRGRWERRLRVAGYRLPVRRGRHAAGGRPVSQLRNRERGERRSVRLLLRSPRADVRRLRARRVGHRVCGELRRLRVHRHGHAGPAERIAHVHRSDDEWRRDGLLLLERDAAARDVHARRFRHRLSGDRDRLLVHRQRVARDELDAPLRNADDGRRRDDCLLLHAELVALGVSYARYRVRAPLGKPAGAGLGVRGEAPRDESRAAPAKPAAKRRQKSGKTSAGRH